MPSNSELNLTEALHERFLQLPKPVQNAIQSADVQKNLRSLADIHKLHLDQWQSLENEVMLTLIGVARVEDLEQNLQKEVGVAPEIAQSLASNISKLIFEPIRQELERQLEHPKAQVETVSETDTARTQILEAEHQKTTPSEPAAPAVQPATPPAPAPEVKISRPTEASAYKPGEASHERTTVHDDPYREPPV